MNKAQDHLVRDEGVAGSNPATPTNTYPKSSPDLPQGAPQVPPPGLGYYTNSLRAQRDRLKRECRFLEARLATLRKTGHPCADAQAKLIELNGKHLEIVESALRAAATGAQPPPLPEESGGVLCAADPDDVTLCFHPACAAHGCMDTGGQP